MFSDLLEARVKYVKENVVFNSSNWDSPYIINALNAIQQYTGASPDKIKEIMLASKQSQDLDKVNHYAPKIFGDMYKNKVESLIFDIFWKHIDPFDFADKMDLPTFSRPMMQRLLNYMAGTMEGEIFPLKSVMEQQTLKHPLIEYSDDYLDSKGNETITTAAATPSGNFIFNEKFMQALMNYASIKGIKPESAYFKSNGGTIPDCYCYAEFVLMHELFHYTHSDFFKQHYLHNPRHQIINIVSDLRTNYTLVKSGFNQLPMGYFSSEFNFDKFKDFNQMYEKYLEEYNKIPKDEREGFDEAAEGLGTDSHEEGNAEGASQGKKADRVSNEQANSHDKAQDKATEKGKQNADKPVDAKHDPTATSTGQPGKGGGYDQQLDLKGAKPGITWKEMIRKFVQSAKPIKIKTYNKISRRAAGMVAAVSKYGAGAVVPGQQQAELTDTNLVIVLDSSGSMGGVAATVLVSVTQLIRQYLKRADFFIVVFSGDAQLYRCNMARNTAIKINNIEERTGEVRQLTDLLTNYRGGGTEFDTTVNFLAPLLAKQYNLLLITDSDIVGGDNLKVFVGFLMKYRRLCNVVLASARDFEHVSKALPIIPNNITHFN